MKKEIEPFTLFWLPVGDDNRHYLVPDDYYGQVPWFIKAEVISFDDYISCNGESGSKEKGKLRLEGKEYIVKDGDVIHFKFNV